MLNNANEKLTETIRRNDALHAMLRKKNELMKDMLLNIQP